MFVRKKVFDHIKHMASVTYKSFSDELAKIEHERDLYRACAEGYKRSLAGAEKEIEFYKNMYEREKRKNEDRENNSNFMRSNYSHVRVVPRVRGIRLP